MIDKNQLFIVKNGLLIILLFWLD